MSGERRCLRSILGDSNIRFGDETVLKDTSTNAIVRQAQVKHGDYVVEVGPGPGSITRAILETNCRRVDVIEIDHRFIPPLEVLKEASEERMFIHRADILKTDIKQIWSQAGVERVAWEEDRLPMAHIIGNLPFNIASPLIIKFLREMLYRQGPWSFGRVPLLLTFQIEIAEAISHSGRKFQF